MKSIDTLHLPHIDATLRFQSRLNQNRSGVPPSKPGAVIGDQNENRIAFVDTFMHGDIREPHHYDLVIHNDRFKAHDMAQVIVHAMKRRGLL